MNGDFCKDLFQFGLLKTVLILQFGKQLGVFGLTGINYLAVFNKIRGLQLSGLGIGIGDEEEKTEYKENYEIGKRE